MNQSGRRWFLTGIGGSVNGREFLLVGEEIRMGRSSDCDVRVTGTSISRQHARILLRDNQCWIHDLGSKNGTFLNEQAVTEAPLQENDILRIGSCRFRVGLEQPTQPEARVGRPESTIPLVSLLKHLGPFAEIGLARARRVPRRAYIYGGTGLLLVILVLAVLPKRGSPPSPAPEATATNRAEASPGGRTTATDDEIAYWRNQAQSYLLAEDYRSARTLLLWVTAARPEDTHSRTQLELATRKLRAEIRRRYENGAREYEKLYFEKALEEWQKVLALSEGFDPEMYRKTEARLREARARLARPR